MQPLRVIFLDVDGVLHPIGEPPYLYPLQIELEEISARVDEGMGRQGDDTYVTRVLPSEFTKPCME